VAIAAGRPAPDFRLPNQHGAQVSLSDFAGAKDVVLVFYPFAFSGVCTGELAEIRDRMDQIVDEWTEVPAVSCDHRYSLRAYADRDGYEFSLLSDFWPHGEVSRAYGVFDERLGCSARATVIVDRGGMVRWTVENDIGQARDFEAYRAVLSGLRIDYSA
jgi:peroxiredoxin (alkyl hydroperoxide reductase subunit C)